MPKHRTFLDSVAPYQCPITGRAALNLDLNENASGCSPRVLKKLQTLTAIDVARYASRDDGERLVANFLALPADHVMVTNGADEALHLVCSAFLDQQAELLIVEPTFSMFRLCGEAAGARITSVPYPPDFRFPSERVLAAISPRTRAIILANPNNPSGTVAPASDLLRIIDSAPDAAVVIDEAYFEFYGHTLIGEIPHHANLIVLRTFSKAYGLAGLRLGVLAASPPTVSILRRIISPFNVNSLSLACLPEALADQEFVSRNVEAVRQVREHLVQFCSRNRIHTWRSHASFVLIEIGPRSSDFVKAMRELGVVIADRTENGPRPGCIRVGIPTHEQLPTLLAAFESSLRRIGHDV